MLVYHGTDNVSADNILKNGIDLSRGDRSVDNGPGFYMTPNRDFAVERARYAADVQEKFYAEKDGQAYSPVVIEIEFVFPEGNSLRIKRFDEVNSLWQEFVVVNRLGHDFLAQWKETVGLHNLDCKFDVVMDPTADTQIADKVDIISSANEQEKLTVAGFREIISQINISRTRIWGTQISVHTQLAIDSCIKTMRMVLVDPE